MLVGSCFAGVGGFDLAFQRAGAEIAFQIEVDKYCQQVLRNHFPEVPKFGDITSISADSLGSANTLVGGFPCQDLSVAGRREGLDGKRSGLFFHFIRLLEEIHPQWFVLENVPGLLSSNRGRDLGTVIREVAQLGYGWAYRVLDSQHFGVAQRRKRVFIVGCLGDGGSAAEVLFDSDCLSGNPPPRREAGEEATGYVGADPQGCWWDGGYLSDTLDVSMLSKSQMMPGSVVFPAVLTFNWQTGGSKPYRGFDPNTVGALSTNQTPAVAAIDLGQVTSWANRQRVQPGRPTPTLLAKGTAHILTSSYIRRLTPLETERLQGFPDNWTEGVSDTQRYKMMGNAVTVPVVEWIAKRLVSVESQRYGADCRVA